MATFSWLVPSLIEGSGGHRTIFQCIHALEQRGHSCYVYIEHPGIYSSTSPVDLVRRLFGYSFANISYGWTSILPCDVAVATVWYSARVVYLLPDNCYKLYFVQDWEAFFNPIGDTYIQAENSYLYGLIPITIGRWLSHELYRRFNLPSYFIDFGVDLSIYQSDPHLKKQEAICFLYQPDKPRRCAQLGLEALQIVNHYKPSVSIYLYGSNTKAPRNSSNSFTNLGLLSVRDCNKLYQQCQAGLCISATNPSRIPFEMMSAGLAVVDLYRDNNLYDFPGDSILLSRSTSEELAASLIFLLEHPDLCLDMGLAGQRWMTHRSLEREGLEFSLIAESILAGGSPSTPSAGTLYLERPEFSSIASVDRAHCTSSVSRVNRHSLTKIPSPIRRLLIAFIRYIKSRVY